MKCPICKGKGEIKSNKLSRMSFIERRREMAKILRKNGFSVREIARMVGYGSTRSVIMATKK